MSVEREQVARDELRIGWEQFANCATVDPDAMFPDKGDLRGSRIARRICANCDVIEPCLADAIANPPDHGIRGGKTVNEIKELRRRSGHSKADERHELYLDRYERAVAMKQTGMSHAAIAKVLGYAWPSGVTALFKHHEAQEAAS